MPLSNSAATNAQDLSLAEAVGRASIVHNTQLVTHGSKTGLDRLRFSEVAVPDLETDMRQRHPHNASFVFPLGRRKYLANRIHNKLRGSFISDARVSSPTTGNGPRTKACCEALLGDALFR